MQRTADTFTKMKFCLLIDAKASKFSAVLCHEMKFSQPRGKINSKLCHAIFVSHYIWLITAKVSASLGTSVNG